MEETILKCIEIGATAVLAIIAVARGKAVTYTDLEKRKQKAIAKKEKEHKATEEKFIKEEQELKALKENK